MSQKLRKSTGNLSATTVLRSYQAAALEITTGTNCIVSWIDSAEDDVKRLDELPPEQRGPLHGVPVSIKECFDVAGTINSCGMAKYADNETTLDCPAVSMIKNLGGVPFCKTNLSQMIYSLQCSNPLYGMTINPHSNEAYPRECGGSSGGEGALIGGGGSMLGLGSDTGGSLRNPVAFCGGYSLKPTAGRHLSQIGVVFGTNVNTVGVMTTGGYMARSAQALEQAWRATWGIGINSKSSNSHKNDPNIVPIFWNEENYSKSVTIGYYTEPGLIPCTPGAARAVKEAKKILEDAGYKMVPFPAPDINKVLHLFNGILMADKNEAIFRNMEYDICDSSLYWLVAVTKIYNLPNIVKNYVIHPLMKLLSRAPSIEKLFCKTSDLWVGMEERNQLIKSYLDLMDEAGVDIILCPGQMFPAPPTGHMFLSVLI